MTRGSFFFVTVSSPSVELELDSDRPATSSGGLWLPE